MVRFSAYPTQPPLQTTQNYRGGATTTTTADLSDATDSDLIVEFLTIKTEEDMMFETPEGNEVPDGVPYGRSLQSHKSGGLKDHYIGSDIEIDAAFLVYSKTVTPDTLASICVKSELVETWLVYRIDDQGNDAFRVSYTPEDAQNFLEGGAEGSRIQTLNTKGAGPCTHDIAWPGWKDRVWCLPGYKNHRVNPPRQPDGTVFDAHCRSCASVDDFWVMWQPNDFWGICACIPEPIEQIKDQYNNGFTENTYFLLFFVIILAYFGILKKIIMKATKHTRSMVRKVKDLTPEIESDDNMSDVSVTVPLTKRRGRPRKTIN